MTEYDDSPSSIEVDRNPQISFGSDGWATIVFENTSGDWVEIILSPSSAAFLRDGLSNYHTPDEDAVRAKEQG